MSDVVKLLPDSVANQIAAGEVVQRPASVVKELVENAIDAGAKEIKIIIKDAGKTLIQVFDNGKGMTPIDARMCFERHATSKISSAEDLFKIRTMGFRGEALASIAAVATVELKTRRPEDEIGTHIVISGSEVKSQEPVSCPAGASFSVKNIFFNIPARRKFLKSDQVEYKHILNEIHRVALAYPEIAFELINNGNVELNLKPEQLKQRIAAIFGKSILNSLIQINVDTSIIKIYGYIGKPDRTRKTTNEQFFFVNNRFMIHPYFRKAVQNAYEKLIPEGEYSSFFIFFETDPSGIDVNIHPTKTEIKFEDENSIFPILHAAVKESLGKFSIVPPLEFEEDITRDVHLTSKTEFKPPTITVNPDYNPFGKENTYKRNPVPRNWEKLYTANSEIEKNPDDFYLPGYDTQDDTQTKINLESITNDEKVQNKFLQIKQKYIITSVKSGMMIIDQDRALERILFEKFMLLLETRKAVCQKTLFPVIYEPSPEERAILMEIIIELNNIGFLIVLKGTDKCEIQGIPGELTDMNPVELVRDMIYVMAEVSADPKFVLNEKIALALSKAAASKTNRILSENEMQTLFYDLMSCKNHNHTPDGKKIIEILSSEEIEKKLNY